LPRRHALPRARPSHARQIRHADPAMADIVPAHEIIHVELEDDVAEPLSPRRERPAREPCLVIARMWHERSHQHVPLQRTSRQVRQLRAHESRVAQLLAHAVHAHAQRDGNVVLALGPHGVHQPMVILRPSAHRRTVQRQETEEEICRVGWRPLQHCEPLGDRGLQAAGRSIDKKAMR
jgi:hypothetical protein